MPSTSSICSSGAIEAHFDFLVTACVVASAVIVVIAFIVYYRLAVGLLRAFYDTHPELLTAWDERDRLEREIRGWPFSSAKLVLFFPWDSKPRWRTSWWWELYLPTMRAWIAADPERECRRRVALWSVLLAYLAALAPFVLLSLLFFLVGWWCTG